MQTIGVLGGLGPQATMDFEQRIHKVSQSLIPPKMNRGYPPMITWFHRNSPMIVDEHIHPIHPLTVNPILLDAAGKLGPLVDFIVIPSNTPHLFTKDIEAASGKPVLSILGVTLDQVRQRGWQHIGVIGFRDPVFYTKPLEDLGIRYSGIQPETAARLNKAIMSVMEGHNDARSSAAAHHAVRELRAAQVDGIILGCTEIPLLVPDVALEDDVLNPAQLLAEAAVRRAIG